MNDIAKQKAEEAFEALNCESWGLSESLRWAERRLTDHEGSGHNIELSATSTGLFQCSFAKPEWSGDHCGRPMPEAGASIVMAVCEYLNGC